MLTCRRIYLYLVRSICSGDPIKEPRPAGGAGCVALRKIDRVLLARGMNDIGECCIHRGFHGKRETCRSYGATTFINQCISICAGSEIDLVSATVYYWR